MKRILIADDQPHVIRVLKLTLEREGYEVSTVGNGAAALELDRVRTGLLHHPDRRIERPLLVALV